MNTYRPTRKKKKKSLVEFKEEFKILITSEKQQIQAGFYANSNPSKLEMHIVPQ